MKSFKVLAVAASIALTASTLGVIGPVRAQDKVIKVASQSPLSGGQSVLGTAISNGTRLGVEQLSESLASKGYKVEYVGFDDQATPDVGVANAQSIVNDASILGVIGHLNSGVAIPSSEVYNKADLVMISPANTGVSVTDRGLPTVNRICGRDDKQGAAGAAYAQNDLQVKSVYVLHDKTAYGEGVATAFRDAAQAAGLEVLGFDGTEEKNDFASIITPIVAQSPELIYFGAIYDQAALFFKQARDAGYTGEFLGPDGMDSSDLLRIGGDAVKGMHYTTTAGPASVFPDAAKFIEDYKARFEINPEPYAVESYAATQILLAAVERVVDAGGEVTRKAVAEEVRKTADFKTIAGTYTFDANGDPTEATYYVLEVTVATPEEWSSPGNTIVSTSKAASPLAGGSAEATPEAATEATPEATPAS
jgi:branched-chain amino acid transport system substrate-binding protein